MLLETIDMSFKIFRALAERHSLMGMGHASSSLGLSLFASAVCHLPFAHELIDKIHDRAQHTLLLTPVSWSSMVNLAKETWHSSPQDKTPPSS
jgi:hypothetical protein